MFFSITASGNYGHRTAIYKLVKNMLVLRDEGRQDGLVGNGLAADFGGLTIEQADEKIETLNAEDSGHSYDGCHACTWRIRMRKEENNYVPL